MIIRRLAGNVGSGWCAAALWISAIGPVWGQLPQAATQAAGPVGRTNATLNGMAVARGNATSAWFEWGTDSSYGSNTAPTDIGAGGQVVRLSAIVEGLSAGESYHYRLVASNSVGTTLGADGLFTTGTRLSSWTDQSVPAPAIPPGLTNLVAQASGHGHSLAITSEGSVAAWGVGIPSFYANYGQTNVPVGLSNVVAVAGGWVHSLALRQDGTVSAWGEYVSPLQPAFVPNGVSNVIAIAGGDSHSVVLKNDGTVLAWGGNGSGQTNVPMRLTNVVAIAAGSTHSLALKADGTVTAWGSEPSGSPTPPAWLSNVVAIASESWHNLALRADSTVVAWGNNTYGQTNVPAGLSNVVAIVAGFQHSLALKSDGTLVAWGNTRYVTNVPAGLSNVVAISSGDYHSVSLAPVNLSPRAFPRLVTGGVNRDLVISLVGWDPNGDALAFRIAAPPTNGTLYQFTGSGRGAAITDPGALLSDPSKVIFTPPRDSVGAPDDAFSFTANDGEYDSPPKLVTINILQPPSIQAAGFAPSGTPGFAVGFSGLSNVAYGVQASTNLIDWSRLGPAAQPTPGQFLFLDTGATNRPWRFYRVTSP